MSSKRLHPLLCIGTVALTMCVAGCADLGKPVPPPDHDTSLQREAMAGTELPPPKQQPLNNDLSSNPTGTTSTAEISRGSGTFVRPTALSTPRRAASGSGAVTFNFENQPVQAVVKAILGDLLHKNYTIVPGVQGNISFSTSEPVENDQALPILETLLSWTHNALVQRDGSFVVMPDKDAVAGNLVPTLGAVAPQDGLQARLFPLHYIAATEMQKLLKPFARADSILLADSARNVIVLSGTPDELDNYQRTIRTFDVDWLRGMSVGVFNLEHANVDELMPQLDSFFGPKSDSPLAGMMRFIPIKRTNALVVISTQPVYLDEVGAWINKIDRGGGNEPQLYVYDVRNLKASDLAKYLAQIYASNGNSNGGDNGGQVGPGLGSSTLGSTNNANGNASGLGSTAGSFGSSTGGGFGSSGGLGGTTGGLGGSTPGSSTGLGTTGFGSSQSTTGTSTGGLGSSSVGNNNENQDKQYSSADGSVRIGSVDANNQLMVRARPTEWAEIQSAIQRLDNVPLQVQIETRILEVTLTGEFSFGVQWYLEGLTGSTTNSDGAVTPGQPYRHRQIGLGGGGNTFTGQPFYYSFMNSKMQVAVSALETSSNTKTLSAPSLVVLNNQTAHIQVGNQIPVNQTSIVTGLGTSTTAGTASTVTYLPTGVILDVQPRVNPGGLVYLNVDQQVSATLGDANSQGNFTIAQRDVGTQIAVQSGQTVLLGGLIQQQDTTTDSGIPGLTRIPILGRLFGTTDRQRTRTELIVLITPKVITDSAEAKQVTDEYQANFESLAPLRQKPVPVAAPANSNSSNVITTPIKQP